MANPLWIKGMQSPNSTGNIKHRQRFKKVDKRSSLEKKIALYLTKKWGRMIEDIEKLNERDRVKAYQDLMGYAIPKKAAINDTGVSQEELQAVNEKLDQVLNQKGYGKAV